MKSSLAFLLVLALAQAKVDLKDRFMSKIINGMGAGKNGDFVVAIKASTGRFCGGSILKANVVLTSATCLAEATRVEVIAGTYIINNNFALTEQHVFSDRIIRHDEWDPATNTNDIALVILPTNLNLGDSIVTVPIEDGSISDQVGRAGSYHGWGANAVGDHNLSAYLRFTLAKISFSGDCRIKFDWFTEKHLCVDNISGLPAGGACKGDAGGPFTVLVDDKDVQVGIIGAAAAEECSGEGPFVFTKVAAYQEWINGHIAAEFN